MRRYSQNQIISKIKFYYKVRNANEDFRTFLYEESQNASSDVDTLIPQMKIFLQIIIILVFSVSVTYLLQSDWKNCVPPW